MATSSFLDVARSLLEDSDAKAAFADDPEGYLTSQGLEGLTADDLADATAFVSDALPPRVAAQLGHPDSWSGDPLGRIAQLDPVPESELEPDVPDDDDGPGWAEAEAEPTDAGVHTFDLIDDTIPDPGFGVGSTLDDVDDLAAPELHDGDLPAGFELDLGAAGPLAGEDAIDPTAYGLVDHDPVTHELEHHDLGHEPVHDDFEHHGHDDPHGHDADDHHGEHGDPLHGLDL